MTPISDSSSLLTTALEKLLYLESRLDSAEAARDEAIREIGRHKAAAQSARQALLDWQRRATDAEVATEGVQREVAVLRNTLANARNSSTSSQSELEIASDLAAAQERLARFERERETWLDRMVTLQRLGSGSDELDLGSFISELRSELLALRRGETDRPRITVSDRPIAPDPVKLLDEAPSGEIDVELLVRRSGLTRPERTLAILCARDLASDTAMVRLRAAQRLVEAQIGALTPFVATRLTREPEVPVRVALIKLLGFSDSESAQLALQRSMDDADPRVRAAALEALANHPGADLSIGLRDSSPAVRRRALSLLPESPERIDHLADALRDDDASVRHVAAIALAGQGGKEAAALLGIAAQSADPEVKAAATHASQIRTGAPSTPLTLSRDQRERVEGQPLVATTPSDRQHPGTSNAPFDPLPLVAAQDKRGGEKTLEEQSKNQMEAKILAEIRTSLRGRSIEELADALGGIDSLQPVVDTMIAARKIVQRGTRLYQR